MEATNTPATAKSAAKKTTKAPRTTEKKGVETQFPYAVLRTGGKQYRVAKGDMILIEKVEATAGTEWTADEILFVAEAPGKFQIGKPTLKGATVKFEVLQQTLDKKILIRHHRRRQNSQKTLGHRQPKTRVLVKEIKA